MWIFTLIGLLVVAKWIVKNRRLFMNFKAFWHYVKDMRSNLQKGYCSLASENLDNLIEIVTNGDRKMNEQSLEKDAISLIKKIKNMKEDEKLTETATKLIEQIKQALDE